MKLKKNGKLMKFYEMFNPELHHDLLCRNVGVCALFWRTVWTVVTVVALAVIICVMAWVLFLNPVLVAVRLIDPSLITVFGVVFMCAVLIRMMWAWLVESVKSCKRVSIETEPGLVRSFIKAKKEKFCPTVEIID